MQSITQSVSRVNQTLFSNTWAVENAPWFKEGRIGVTSLAVGTGVVEKESSVSGHSRNKNESFGRRGLK
jgi:hypothetical protein